MSDARATGQRAERQAARWLSERGLRALDHNYHCRAGELDLIMLDGDTLVFVEVRYRRSARFGDAAESVTPAKQRKLLSAARHYLQYHDEHAARALRFDVIAMTGERMEWIKNAFGA